MTFKLSELIKQLEELSQQYGDSEVAMIVYDHGCFNASNSDEFTSEILGDFRGTIFIKK